MGKIALFLFSLLIMSIIPYDLSADDKYESVPAIVKMQKKDLKVAVYHLKRNKDNKNEDDLIESRKYITSIISIIPLSSPIIFSQR
jgi:hypothetical protein